MDIDSLLAGGGLILSGGFAKMLFDFLKDRHNARNQRTAITGVPQPMEVQQVQPCTPREQCEERHKAIADKFAAQKEQIDNLFLSRNAMNEKLASIETKVDMIHEHLTGKKK